MTSTYTFSSIALLGFFFRLDRARTAMEETYPTYEEPIYHEGAPAAHYDNYSYSQHHTSAPRTARYEAADYDAEYRREYYREPPAYAGKNPPYKKARHDAINYEYQYYY